MRGGLVIARIFGDKPAIYKVWFENERGVWLVTEPDFELLSSGKGGIEPTLGFPRRDVFKYEHDFALMIINGDFHETWNWNQLTHY